jgi:DNA (cytosine-5)-methyltransferase 1
LDLFSGEGGSGWGYELAGIAMTGVDNRPMPRYRGSRFIQADAFEYLADHGHEYDFIHASPPCQGYSRMRHLPWLKDRVYPLLIAPVRAAILPLGVPYVIENVEDARPHMRDPIRLCGLSFGLRMYRHRMFESSLFMLEPPHEKHREVIFKGRLLNSRYSGSAGTTGILPDPAGHVATNDAKAVMGVEWMSRNGMTQAIPPAFTLWIGRQIVRALAEISA